MRFPFSIIELEVWDTKIDSVWRRPLGPAVLLGLVVLVFIGSLWAWSGVSASENINVTRCGDLVTFEAVTCDFNIQIRSNDTADIDTPNNILYSTIGGDCPEKTFSVSYDHILSAAGSDQYMVATNRDYFDDIVWRDFLGTVEMVDDCGLSMDPASLAGGMGDSLTDWGDGFGPIVLTTFAIALGLFGLTMSMALLPDLFKGNSESKKRRKNKTA